MAGQSITFDFLTRGADTTASGFRKVGDNTVLAARGAKVLADAIGKLGDKEDRTAAESKILATALKQTGDAEDRVAAKAVLADAAIRRLDDSMKDSQKKSSDLNKALGGLKLNPGLLGPAVALAPAIATLGGAVTAVGVGLAGAFTAGAGALAAFGVVAKPVLTSAKTAADAVNKAQDAYNATLKAGVPTAQAQARLQAANASAQLTYNAALKGGANPAKALAAYHLALSKNQLAYNTATNAGTFNAKAYAAEQKAISKAYAGMSPQQIALSKQLGDMANSWDAVKTAETPVVAGALQPWLKSVTDLTKNLAPIIAKIAPVIQGLGGQFDSLINSSAFKAFRDFIGATGAAAVSAGGSTIIDLVKSFMILLPRFDPLIREAVGWISRLGPAVLSWASSKKAADDITKFMQWFSKNGPVVGGLLRNIGGALKALAPGLAAGGVEELKIISGFLGLIAKLPPAIAKPLAEVAGAALILSKMGVLKVGLQVVGPAVKWLSGGLINLGGGAAAGAEIRTAMVSGGAAAAAEIRAAMAGGGAAGGAGGIAGGGAAGAAAGKAAGGGFIAAFRAAISPVMGGVLLGALIRAAGDTLSPSGSFAGRLNAQFQADGHMWSTTLLHSFTFGGLEGWLTAKIGLPVGGFLNGLAAGAKTWGGNVTKTVVGAFGNIAGGAKTWWGDITGTVSKAWGTITGQSSAGGKAVSAAFGAAGRAADALRTRNLVPLLGQTGKVTGGIQGLAGMVSPRLTGAMDTGGQHVNSFRTNNLGPLQGSLSRTSGGVQGLQGLINNMHGKTVNVGVHASGSGGMTFTQKVAASISSGGFSLRSLAAGGLVRMGSGPTADDVPAMLSKGELVVPAHMVKAGAADNLRGRIPGFAAGGIAGMTPFAAGAEYDFGHAVESALLRAEFANLKKAVAANAKAKAAAFTASRVPNAGSGVMRWAPLVLQALKMEGLGAYLASQVLYQMNTESGGNPNAINLTDSNAAAGDPSRGLLQTIGSTFRAYHWPGTSNNIYDPLANIAAAINYARHRYGPTLMSGGMGMGSGHGYAAGGLVGYASGGTVAQQGRQYLDAWRSRHGGPYALAIGPKTLNQQIPAMAAAVGRARTLAGAGGLSPGQHKFWANAAAGESRLLATLRKELGTEQAWRGQLGSTDTTLAREIAAAGNLPALAPAVKGWKAQMAAHKYTIGQISGMLGLTSAQAAAAAKPPAKPPAPTGVQATHTYGGDVANNLGAVLQAALGPFTGAARGGMVFDQGGTLRPGFNPVWNGTGRPESLVPARSGAATAIIQVESSGNAFDQFMLAWMKKHAKIKGGGSVQVAFGSR